MAEDSRSDSGSKGLRARFSSFITRRPIPSDDKYPSDFVKEALLDEDDILIEQSEGALRLMPETLRRVYARMLMIMTAASDTLKTQAPFKEKIAKGEDVKVELWHASAARTKPAIAGLLTKVQSDGVGAAVRLPKEWEEFVQKFATSSTIDPLKEGTDLETARRLGAGGFAEANPALDTRNLINWSDLNSIDTHLLILGLADGLEYDRFDTKKLRSIVFGRKPPPSLNEFVTVCATYIYVGNNQARLTNKVKSAQVGQAALGVLNKNGIVRTKINSSTITLARWGIAFSPAIWALRNIYQSSGRLAGAGVVTSTPLVLQDVALSGVSDRIASGSSIEDFLIKFNRALFDFKEKGDKAKTPESDRDAVARKYYGVSLAGAKADHVLQGWNYNSKRDEVAIHEFYELCLNESHLVPF